MSRLRVAPTDGSPPRKIKFLTDIDKTHSVALNVTDSLNFNEVVKYKEWRDAIGTKLSPIQSNNTWQLIDLPLDKRAVGLKWICKIKYGVGS